MNPQIWTKSWPKMFEFGRILPNLWSNLIEFGQKGQIRPKSIFEFVRRNLKFRNSNEFERIRPSLAFWPNNEALTKLQN